MAFRSGDGREVGWFSWVEWHHVHKLLYSYNDINRQVKGINMVNVWRSRLPHRGLPVSVDLTAALVAAYVGNTTCSYGNEFQAQMSSAMAILRFVNGVTDVHQSGLYAQSVQEIADKINIPDWMVDLRHESAHGKLPSYDLLKQGLVIALSWLDEHYWQETATKLERKEQEFNEKVSKGLGEFSELTIQIVASSFNKNSHKSAKEQQRILQKRTEKCTDIAQQLHKYVNIGNMKLFIAALLQEGIFVLTAKQLQSLSIGVDTADAVLDEGTIEKLVNISTTWKVIFDSYGEVYPSFARLAAQELAKAMQQNDSDASYVSYLLSVFVMFKCCDNVDKVFVKHLLLKPSQMSYDIVRVIIAEGSFSERMKSKFTSFLDIFAPAMHILNRKTDPFDPHHFEMMSAEAASNGKDILQRLEEAKNAKTLKNEDTTTWTLVPSVANLPPMGEFASSDKYFDLDMNNLAEHSLEKIMCDSGTTEMKKIDAGEHHDNLKYAIDNLFLDPTVYVSDHYMSSDSSTDEYLFDEETAWDAAVDFNFDEKHSLKSGSSTRNFIPRPKSLKECNISKVVFF